jgi:hypothetical protein
MRLVMVELNRFRSRRAVALLGIAAVLVAAVLVGKTAWDTRPLTREDRVDATAQAQLEGQRAEIQQEVRACRADPADYLGPDAEADDCADALVPGPDAYYPRESLSLREVLSPQGLGVPLGLIVAGLMVIAGCTFAGADWSSRSMANQLIFEPRRVRLWLAKGLAVALGCGVIALVAIGGFWLAVAVVAQARDVSMPGPQVEHVSWHVVRAVALSMGAGLGAFALTMIFRHTVATLALLFVYSIGGEIVVNLLPVEGGARWSLGNNALGWLALRHRYFDPSTTCVPGDRCSSVHTLTHLEAGTFLGVLLAVSVVVSLVWFSRRDV